MNKWNESLRRDIIVMRDLGRTFKEIGEEFGISEEQARGIYRRGLIDTERVEDADLVIVGENNPRVSSLIKKAEVQDLLANGYRITKVMSREWPTTMKFGRPGEEHIEQKTNYYAGFELRPDPALFNVIKVGEDVLAKIRDHAPIYEYDTDLQPKKNVLIEISIFDPHFGKLASRSETGESYDLNIVTERTKAAFYQLLERTVHHGPKAFLLVIGNDLLHIDNLRNLTPKGQNLLDTDTRYHKIFYRVLEVYIEFIEVLATMGEVYVPVIPGNHDELAAFHIGVALEAWFWNNPRVHVDNAPKLRKYFQWDKVGLMFTHGHNENPKDLPGIFAREERTGIWANCAFREVHLGHLHKRREYVTLALDEDQEVSVRHLPSLSANDAWHDQRGYGSLKRSMALVWDGSEGLIGEAFATFPRDS